MSGTEKTDKKQSKPHLFKPGQSGNPKGRPKGSRQRLGEAFLSALADDFESHGISAIEEVRRDKPSDYLKVCASILPKELNVTIDPLAEMTDEELRSRLDDLDSALGAALGREDKTQEGDVAADRDKQAGPLQSVH